MMPEYAKTLLKKIRETPGMYIGKKSLDRLAASLSGYACCMREKMGVQDPPLPGFQAYIEAHYNQHSHSWWDIISFDSTCEEEAFDTFYRLLDLFYPGWDR